MRPMSPPSVSVIVVNYNGGAFLRRLFRSLEEQTVRPKEILMVDNASSDGSVALVRSEFPDVSILDAGGNVGFAVANNLAVRATDGEFIALLNSDAYADREWVSSLASALSVSLGAAAAVGKILSARSPEIIDQAGGLFNNVGNYWGRGHLERDQGQFDAACEVPGITACAMMLRREALAGEDLFDSDFFMYGEELDLTLRLRGRGYSIVYTPNAVAYHEGMGSLSSRPDARLFQQYHANCNRLKILARRFPRPLLLRSLLPLVLGFFYWNAFFLRRGGLRFAIRALGTQVRSIRRGLALRSAREREEARLWLPWLIHQGVRDMLSLKRQTHRY